MTKLLAATTNLEWPPFFQLKFVRHYIAHQILKPLQTACSDGDQNDVCKHMAGLASMLNLAPIESGKTVFYPVKPTLTAVYHDMLATLTASGHGEAEQQQQQQIVPADDDDDDDEPMDFHEAMVLLNKKNSEKDQLQESQAETTTALMTQVVQTSEAASGQTVNTLLV